MAPTLNSSWVSEQARLPCSGANTSGHLMAREVNKLCHNLQVYPEARFALNSFIHASNNYLLSTCYVRHFAREQLFPINRTDHYYRGRGRDGGLTDESIGRS